MTDETSYSLQRAEWEAVRSVAALDPRAAAAHAELSRLHTTRAIRGLAALDRPERG